MIRPAEVEDNEPEIPSEVELTVLISSITCLSLSKEKLQAVSG